MFSIKESLEIADRMSQLALLYLRGTGGSPAATTCSWFEIPKIVASLIITSVHRECVLSLSRGSGGYRLTGKSMNVSKPMFEHYLSPWREWD